MPRIRQNAGRYRTEDFQKALGHAQVDAGLRTISDVAAASGIATTTLWRRWKDPDTMTVRELRELLSVLPVPVGALLALLGVKTQKERENNE